MTHPWRGNGPSPPSPAHRRTDVLPFSLLSLSARSVCSVGHPSRSPRPIASSLHRSPALPICVHSCPFVSIRGPLLPIPPAHPLPIRVHSRPSVVLSLSRVRKSEVGGQRSGSGNTDAPSTDAQTYSLSLPPPPRAPWAVPSPWRSWRPVERPFGPPLRKIAAVPPDIGCGQGCVSAPTGRHSRSRGQRPMPAASKDWARRPPEGPSGQPLHPPQTPPWPSLRHFL